jgi:putative endonuclease
MPQYFTYILKCADNSYYTGVTNDIERRYLEHQHKEDPDCYTATKLPVELVFLQTFRYIDKAIAFEKRIKGWSRKKKEALINDQ